MLDYSEIGDDETWELFARDYLAELGFVIELEPGRGADQGRDILVSEQMTGRFRTEKFTWLVSCKYYTKSDRSVGTTDEQNISDRLRHHRADGFIGFYSTVGSSSLIDRLKELKSDGSMRAYEVFDRKKIENRFYAVGSSKLALRYFPESYGRMRPLQKLLGEYVPLECEICGRDVLKLSLKEPMSAIVAWSVPSPTMRGSAKRKVESGHIVCKGACDRKLQARLTANHQITMWEDIGDLLNPILYLKSMIGYMNQLKQGDEYTDEAHEFKRNLYIAIAQRTLREVTEEDTERMQDLSMFPSL